MSHGKVLKGLGAQVVFPSVLPGGDWELGTRRITDLLNEQLNGWCHSQDSGYYDLGCSFEKEGMLILDRKQLTRTEI